MMPTVVGDGFHVPLTSPHHHHPFFPCAFCLWLTPVDILMEDFGVVAEGASCREAGRVLVLVVVGGDLKGTSSSLLCCCAIPLTFHFIFPTATCLERSGVDLISQVISRERAGEGGGEEVVGEVTIS